MTDIMVTLAHEFAGRITFIHEEVCVGNDSSRRLRPPLTTFHLHTEP